MTVDVKQNAGAPPAAAARIRLVLSADTAFGSLGLYTLFPVLGLLLAARSGGGGTALVGIGLFCYTASAGLSALLINRWLPKVRYSFGMVGSLVLSAAAFGLLPYVDSPSLLCVLLVLAALGVSVHFVLSRVLIAEMVVDNIGRNRIYSTLQIALNGGAAIGPFVASFLFNANDPRLLLGIVAACYLLAALSVYMGIPCRHKPPATTIPCPISTGTLRRVLRTSGGRATVGVGVLGAFIYAQFFSAFALLVAHDFDSAGLRAALLAGPAVLIVLTQTGVTGVVSRLMRSGTHPFTVLAGSTLVFGIAMLLLGLGPAVILLVAGAVVVFSFAEMLFAPIMSTAFAALPIDSKLEAFNLRQICWTLGEAFGSLAGGGLFLAMHLTGHGRWYWLVLGVLTIAVTAVLLCPTRIPVREPASS